MRRGETNRPDYPAPPFAGGSSTDRDAVMSQIGNFSHTERRLFHLICAMWEPEIPYKRVLAQADADTSKLSAALPSLMEKLQRGRIGLILTVVHERVRLERAILLTAEGSALFYEKLIEEQIQKVSADPALALPTPVALSELGLPVPDAVIRRLSMNDIVTLSQATTPPSDHAVAAVYLDPFGDLFLPWSRPGSLVPLALKKLRYHLDNTNLVSLIARLRDTSLTDVKRRIESSDASGWHEVIETILNKRDAIEEGALRVPEDFFVAARIMESYISARQEYRKRKQLNDEQRAELAGVIEEAVRDADGYILAQAHFRDIVAEKAPGDDADSEQLRASLVKRLTTPPTGRHLPRTLQLSEGLLHRDNLYLVLLQRLDYLADLIRKEYIRDMEESLQSNERDRFLFFLSLESWETDIAQRVDARDPLVVELLAAPEILAEAMVHAARKRLSLSDPRDLKRQLELVFKPESIVVRPYHQLLSLDLSAIFEVAFTRVGVLRQLLLRISGRLETTRRRCSEVTESGGTRIGATGRSRIMEVLTRLDQGSSDSPGRTVPVGPPASGKRMERGADPPGTRRGGIGPRGVKAATKPVRRAYSQQQREDAWKEFEKNLRNKGRGPGNKPAADD